MAKKAYVGVDRTARRIRKGYVGVDGVARRIRKAYIGVGGVARPCWGTGTLTRYGIISQIVGGINKLAAASVGTYKKYALFAGGLDTASASTGQRDAVWARDGFLTYLSDITPLGQKRYDLSGVSFGDYAIFAGGAYHRDGIGSDVITFETDAYDVSLTHNSAISHLSKSVQKPAAATIGNAYALFVGGYPLTSNGYSYADAYDVSLTHSVIDSIIDGMNKHAGASVGDYALFAGGVNASNGICDRVCAYDKSLTRSEPAKITSSCYYPAGASVGDYAMFIGGYGSNGYKGDIDVYDKSLTHLTKPASSSGTSYIGFTVTVGNGDYALFVDKENRSNVVYAFDRSLTRTIFTGTQGLSDKKVDGAAAAAGDYAIFVGGNLSNDYCEAYVIN